MEKDKAKIKEELLNFKCPRWQDLPDFDIYMDQVVFYINQQLSVLNISENGISCPVEFCMVRNEE